MEALGFDEIIDGVGDRALEVGSECEVDDFATIDAQEMVVVFGEVLREFETREIVVSSDPSD